MWLFLWEFSFEISRLFIVFGHKKKFCLFHGTKREIVIELQKTEISNFGFIRPYVLRKQKTLEFLENGLANQKIQDTICCRNRELIETERRRNFPCL